MTMVLRSYACSQNEKCLFMQKELKEKHLPDSPRIHLSAVTSTGMESSLSLGTVKQGLATIKI